MINGDLPWGEFRQIGIAVRCLQVVGIQGWLEYRDLASISWWHHVFQHRYSRSASPCRSKNLDWQHFLNCNWNRHSYASKVCFFKIGPADFFVGPETETFRDPQTVGYLHCTLSAGPLKKHTRLVLVTPSQFNFRELFFRRILSNLAQEVVMSRNECTGYTLQTFLS